MRDQGYFFVRREVQQRQEQITIEGIALTSFNMRNYQPMQWERAWSKWLSDVFR